MGRSSRLMVSLRTAVEHRVSREFASDVFEQVLLAGHVREAESST